MMFKLTIDEEHGKKVLERYQNIRKQHNMICNS
jgi:hypothetical protein